MSQVSIIDIEGNNPQIPTEFVADAGSAIPIANVLEILGTSVVSGVTPVETTGSGNTITVEVQTSQAVAASDASKIGLANFDSSTFSVDASGFVTLVAGGGNITNINVDASTAPGTDPVVPAAGFITMTGAQVAAGVVGTNVIRTDSLAANTVTVEIQRSSAVGASALINNGVSHFNAAQFSVDSNGFVSLGGGGLAVDSLGVQATSGAGTDPVLPTVAGVIELEGALVVAGTNPLRAVSTAANTVQYQVQTSQALAGTDSTKTGLCNFNSTQFAVDANGFVTLAGGGLAIDSIGVDATSGGGTNPVLPTVGGLVTVNGAVVAAGTTPIRSVSTAVNVYQIQAQTSQALAATDATKIGLSNFDSSSFAVDANGFVTAAATGLLKTLTPNEDFDGTAATPISPQAGNINILGVNPSFATVTETYNTTGAATGNMNVEHRAWTTGLVVDASTTLGTRGTYSTIAAAITAAPAGSTIFIRPGTYTENLSITKALNFSTYVNNQNQGTITGTGLVTIIGKTTVVSINTTVSFTGITLRTNSDFILSISGASNSSFVKYNNCYLDGTNGTIFSSTTTGSGSVVMCFNCFGDLGTTGIKVFAGSGSGNDFYFYNCSFSNSGASTTANTIVSAVFYAENTTFSNPITATSMASFFLIRGGLETGNTTSLTTVTSGTYILYGATFGSGSASAISVGASTTVAFNQGAVTSSNANAITGAGTLNYAGLVFAGTSSNINTTTQTVGSEGPSRTIGSANTGATNTNLITNSSNTASSNALEQVSVGGTSAGDPFTTYTVSGTTNWSQGIDNSVTGDPYVLAASTALGTTNVMSATTAGEVNWPLQPAFCARPTSLGSIVDVTGDGTAYTVVFASEYFDANGDFDGTSTFTAPVTGRYFFEACIALSGLTALHTSGYMTFVTSGEDFECNNVFIGVARNAAGIYSLQGTILTQLTAGDTVTLVVVVSGSTKVVDIPTSTTTTRNCHFSGSLET